MNEIVLKAEKRVDFKRFISAGELSINLQLSYFRDTSRYNNRPKTRPPGPAFQLNPERRGYDRINEREAYKKQSSENASVQVDAVNVSITTRNV
ncbi:MAG: hypothetical protein ACOY46_05850 [Bacillota bacterium]